MEMVIDRFEGDWAVIEYDEVVFNLPRNLLPIDAREGDIINVYIEINKNATEERKKKIEKLMNDLLE